MDIPQKILDEIWEYCRANKITDVDGFIIKMFKQGFTVEKFGATPSERVIEKEVEKIVEVPIEVIKEVEVIKEIEVIKEVKITDDVEMQKLIDKIVILEEELVKMKEIDYTILTKKEESRELEISNLNDKIKVLERELETEKARPKEENKKDIYGDEKKGFFGSNTSDIWKGEK
jgi:hypothetical protein